MFSSSKDHCQSKIHRTSVRPADFTLLEILVAMSISAVLTAGIIQLLGGSKRTDYLNDQLATMQENARIALSILANDIRLAGNLGCADPNNGGLSVSQTVQGGQIIQELADSNRLLVAGNQANGTTPLIYGRTVVAPVVITGADDETPINDRFEATPRANDHPNVAEKSDVLIIQRAEPNGVELDNIGASRNEFTLRNAYPTLEAGNLAIITDCKHLDMFYVSRVGKDNKYILDSPHNSPNTLYTEFNVLPTNVGLSELQLKAHRFRGDVYFIANENNSGIPTLYRTDLYDTASTNQEIVRGIESLQVLYGVEADPEDGSADVSYVTADVLNDMPNPRVLSVRIALLVRSYQPVLSKAAGKQFNLLGKNWESPEDKYMRSVFTSTVKVRNSRPDV